MNKKNKTFDEFVSKQMEKPSFAYEFGKAEAELKSDTNSLDLKDREVFRKVLSALITYTVTTGSELAEEFEVGESTVARWKNGVANPHPRIKKLIIEYLLKKID